MPGDQDLPLVFISLPINIPVQEEELFQGNLADCVFLFLLGNGACAPGLTAALGAPPTLQNDALQVKKKCIADT